MLQISVRRCARSSRLFPDRPSPLAPTICDARTCTAGPMIVHFHRSSRLLVAISHLCSSQAVSYRRHISYLRRNAGGATVLAMYTQASRSDTLTRQHIMPMSEQASAARAWATFDKAPRSPVRLIGLLYGNIQSNIPVRVQPR